MSMSVSMPIIMAMTVTVTVTVTVSIGAEHSNRRCVNRCHTRALSQIFDKIILYYLTKLNHTDEKKGSNKLQDKSVIILAIPTYLHPVKYYESGT